MEKIDRVGEDLKDLELKINRLIEILMKFSNLPEETKEKLRWI